MRAIKTVRSETFFTITSAFCGDTMQINLSFYGANYALEASWDNVLFNQEK